MRKFLGFAPDQASMLLQQKDLRLTLVRQQSI